MFATRFEAEDIFSKAAGASYRREILAPGGSRDALVASRFHPTGDAAPRSVSSRCILTRSECEPNEFLPARDLRLRLFLTSAASVSVLRPRWCGSSPPGSEVGRVCVPHARLAADADQRDERRAVQHLHDADAAVGARVAGRKWRAREDPVAGL